MARIHKILMAAWETKGVIPCSGTGVVVRALSEGLKRKGHDVAVIMPRHGEMPNLAKTLLSGFTIPWQGKNIAVVLYESIIPKTNIPLFLLDSPGMFDETPYHDHSGPEDVSRYIFAGLALSRAIKDKFTGIDVLHFHDIPFALAAPVIKTRKILDRAALIGTIHYGFGRHQGDMDPGLVKLTGLRGTALRKLQHAGRSKLILGLDFCDRLNTVSQGFAKELVNSTLAGSLQIWCQRLFEEGRFRGIVNGLDHEEWDVFDDQNIIPMANQPPEEWKQANKAKLQKTLGLAQTNAPLLGMASRLSAEKFGLLVQGSLSILEQMIKQTQAQFVVLAIDSGNSGMAEQLKALNQLYPERVRIIFDRGFAHPLHHLIYAGADFNLMPSIQEPCGTSQFIAMRYFTLPVVTPVGGLVETVDRNRGFIAEKTSPADYLQAVLQAIGLYHQAPQVIQAMRLNAHSYDSSWSRSVSEYEDMYASV